MAQLIKGKQIKSQTVTINGYTGNVVVQGNLNMGANLVTTTASSFSNNNLVTKAYVDTVAQGLDPKESVVTATVTSENITIETPGSTIGGYTLSVVGSRILLKNQTITTQNGIYSWNGVDVPMTRTTDSDGTPASEVTLGNFTFVEKGTNASTGWVLSSSDSTTSIVIPDTNTQLWTLFSGAGTYSADGQGIEVSGGQFYLEIDGTTLYKSVNGLKLSDSISTAISNSTVGVTSLTTRVSIEETVRQTGDMSLTTRVSVEEYTSSIAVSNGTVADNSLTTRISLEESNRLVDISNGIVADISLTTRISLEESNRLVDISQLISTDVSLETAVDNAYIFAFGSIKSNCVFDDYSILVNDINGYDIFGIEPYGNLGQTFFIKEVNVPDLWISNFSNTHVPYIFTSTQQFIDDINSGGGKVQVGYYFLSFIEAKSDLSNYATNVALSTGLSQRISTDVSLETFADNAYILAFNSIKGNYAFDDYSFLVNNVNGYDSYGNDPNGILGQSLFIKEVNIPDLWISNFSTTHVPYIFTSTQQFIDDINSGGGKVQVGYYFLSFIETKSDLSNYETNVALSTGLSQRISTDVSLSQSISTGAYNLSTGLSQRISTDMSLSQSISTGAYNLSTMISQRVSVDSLLQPKSDPTLNTNSKIIVNAINEINDIATGATQALIENDYETFVGDALQWLIGDYNIGQTFYILTVDVPDLWLSDINTDIFVSYTYTTDQQFIDDINLNGGMLQVGYYYVSKLETQKVDLTNYVTTQTLSTGLSQRISTDVSLSTAIDNKVSKNGTDRLITSDEAFLLENMSPIEFEVTDVINGIIIPESPTKLYRISTATDLTVTINTALLDLTKYIKLFVKINLNDYVVLTFPENWYFSNLAIPTEVGEYLYEVSSSDGGDTWRASLRYKNIATVGIDQEGNEIVGAKTLFVDGEKADNSGNGLTWLTAKKDVQAAIDIANTGDAVFVKGKLDGLKYLPTTERTPGTARSKSFVMKAGVNVYGGFMGIESTLYERQMVRYPQTMNLPTGTFTMYVDIPKYRSILSGEIARDSVINPSATVGNQFTTASIANNSFTVVIGSLLSVMNGFEVLGGNGASTDLAGGVVDGNISNCLIYNNTSLLGNLKGGGCCNCKISNSIIRNNTASASQNRGCAGGMYGGTILNCVVHSNMGGSGSGGLHNVTGQNSAIFNNSAPSPNTGGVYSSTLSQCVIYLNTSGEGGSSNSNLTNCSVYANSGTICGGCVSGTIINCRIYNNSSTNTSGGVSGATCINCSIFNNSAGTNGGGASGGTLINCSVVRNRATVGGGSHNSILRNTVVYGNKTGALIKSNVYNDNASAETYSAFEDEVRTGTGNLSLSVNNSGDATSPCFQSLSTDVGVVDEIYVSNLKIYNDSYLIDKGLDSYLTTGYGSLYDIESKTRKVGTIDIGAYENQKTV